jgi:hypothetical protein
MYASHHIVIPSFIFAFVDKMCWKSSLTHASGRSMRQISGRQQVRNTSGGDEIGSDTHLLTTTDIFTG